MSLDAMIWATKDAPTADAYERCILNALGETADEDGCDAFLSQKTIARMAHCDPKTVGRKMADMEQRGLLARGDQNAAAYLPENRRPTVYDLQIPYTWFGSKIERVNDTRARRGRAPLAPDDRPEIGPPPSKTERSDKGKPNPDRRPHSLGPRPDQANQGSAAWGDSESPQSEAAWGDSQSRPGGIESPSWGDSQSPEPQVRNQKDEPPHPPTGGESAHARDAHTREGPPSQTPRKPQTRKARWPGEFVPSSRMLAWAAKHYPAVDVAAETRAFNAHNDAPEREGMVRDWPASWRTWVKKAAERGPTRRPTEPPPTAEELTAVRPLADRWWGWCQANGRLFGEQQQALEARLVEFARAGVTHNQLAQALWACQEPVPPSFKVAKALRGEITPPGPGGGKPPRPSTTDQRVAQVSEAGARVRARLAAQRAAGGGQTAIEGGY